MLCGIARQRAKLVGCLDNTENRRGKYSTVGAHCLIHCLGLFGMRVKIERRQVYGEMGRGRDQDMMSVRLKCAQGCYGQSRFFPDVPDFRGQSTLLDMEILEKPLLTLMISTVEIRMSKGCQKKIRGMPPILITLCLHHQ